MVGTALKGKSHKFVNKFFFILIPAGLIRRNSILYLSKKIPGLIILCLFLSASHRVFSQSSADTLEMTRQLRDKGKIKTAYKLIKKYYSHHPDDFNSNWIYGQLAYFTRNFRQSASLYEKAIQLSPGNMYLQFDYARMLFNIGGYAKAEPWFKRYLSYDPSNKESRFYLNEIGYITGKYTDTLEMVRRLRNQGKSRSAFSLMKSYYPDHPDDFNTNWLYAQSAYYAHHIKKSKALYDRAITLSPQNLYLQLDYAKKLVNITEYEKAKKLLTKYLAYDSTNSQAITSLARISFWQGDYSKALSELYKIQPAEIQNKEVMAFIQDIQIAKSPWISLKEGYLTDDQPLQSFTSQLEGGIYLHPLSSLHFSMRVPVFITGDKTSQAFWFQGGNRSVLGKAKMDIEADLGLLKFPVKNSIDWTGNLEIDKIFLRHMVISVQAGRIPYFYTLSSIDTMVIDNHGSFKLGWNDLKSWNGEASFDIHQYPVDNNYLFGFSAWVFAPPVKFSFFELRFGYGFNYSTTQKNHFVPEKSLVEILKNYDPSAQINGIYNPYFTPKDQSIHSILAGISISPGKIVNFTINGNFGIYSTAQIPYFFLDNNAQSTLEIMNDFVKKRYIPVQLNAVASIPASKTVRIKVEYSYNKTYYFNSHYAGIGMTINFWNGRKTK